MPSDRRIRNLNSLLRKEISTILLKRERFSREVLISVTKVDVSQDLSKAKVYISIFPDEKYPEMISILKHDIYDIQQRINKILNIRVVPKIEFLEDKETKHQAEVDKILEKIKNGQVAK